MVLSRQWYGTCNSQEFLLRASFCCLWSGLVAAPTAVVWMCLEHLWGVLAAGSDSGWLYTSPLGVELAVIAQASCHCGTEFKWFFLVQIQACRCYCSLEGFM